MAEFRGKSFTDARLAKVLQSRPRLKILRLFDTSVTDAGIRSVEKAAQLEELNITSPLMGNAVLEVECHLPKLRSLLLGRMLKVDDAGLRHLRDLTHLRELYLEGTSITDAGLELLQPLKELWSLDISNALVTDAGLRILGDLPKLVLLLIENTCVRGEGLAFLHRSERLDVYAARCPLADERLDASLRSLPNLRRLDVSETPIGDAGMLSVKCCQALDDLRLDSTNVSDATLELVVDLPRLDSLYTWDTRITKEALSRFRKRRPDVTVYSDPPDKPGILPRTW